LVAHLAKYFFNVQSWAFCAHTIGHEQQFYTHSAAHS
jgi:hypothetical protein